MPFAGIARVDILISNHRGPVASRANLFLWDVSATGGSVLTSRRFPLSSGAVVTIDFFDGLSSFSYAVDATIVWVSPDAFGFKMHSPSQEFLEWAHSRLPKSSS